MLEAVHSHLVTGVGEILYQGRVVHAVPSADVKGRRYCAALEQVQDAAVPGEPLRVLTQVVEGKAGQAAEGWRCGHAQLGSLRIVVSMYRKG